MIFSRIFKEAFISIRETLDNFFNLHIMLIG